MNIIHPKGNGDALNKLWDRSGVLRALAAVLLLALISSPAGAHGNSSHVNSLNSSHASRDAVTHSGLAFLSLLAAKSDIPKIAQLPNSKLKTQKNRLGTSLIFVTSSAEQDNCFGHCPTNDCSHCSDCCPCGSGSVASCSFSHAGLVPYDIAFRDSPQPRTRLMRLDRTLNGLAIPPELKPPRA